MNRIRSSNLLLFLLCWFVLFLAGCTSTTTAPNTSTTTVAGERYTIVWQNWDEEVLETDVDVREGTMPSYDGIAPTRSSDLDTDYEFSGWSPTVSIATGHATYVAQYDEYPRVYSFDFETNGGSVLSSLDVNYGAMVTKPTDPTREGYRFIAWCSDSGLTHEVVWPVEVDSNMTVYAKWNEVVDYAAYLDALLTNYDFNPYAYIPTSMIRGNTLVLAQSTTPDYSSFLDVSDLLFGGYGEQWRMVIDNIEQSAVFFATLEVVDTLATASVVAFNNYLDSNPADSAHYVFEEGIYDVTISFEGGIMEYVLDYTTELPIFGVQTVQIALNYNIETSAKVGRIQIGDANALRYEVEGNSYTFAIRYLGVRRAIITMERDGDTISGSIYEYLGDEDVFTLSSCAEFFIDDEYVSVVGNKAGSMLGWSGYITELYDIEQGRLLGYCVQETLSSITYNTLWINLDDISGIDTIKALTAPLEESNPDHVYVNGGTNVFVTKLVGGLGTKMFSRRYDIELRTQYFYYFDGSDIVEVAVKVPMLFVQIEQYGTLETDVNAMNSGLSFGFELDETVRQRIIADYGSLIAPFITDKDSYTPSAIVDWIGSRIIHE